MKTSKALSIGISLFALTGSLFAQFGQVNPGSVRKPRPRVIATTDGEIDDRCSMVRFLLYANEWEIEGLIHSSSRFHWLGKQAGESTFAQNAIPKDATDKVRTQF